MAGETTWEFDARQDHPLAARRIPVIGTTHPQWRYEVALCVAAAEPWSPRAGLEPTPLEADLIVQVIEYRMEYYNASWAARMRERALDVDGSTNTVVLRKRPDGGWQFRRDSWRYGPIFVPEGRSSLPDVLERCFGRDQSDGEGGQIGWESEGWKAWKVRNAALIASVRDEWASVQPRRPGVIAIRED